jgi:signal transduction histidine kinase
LPVVSYLAVPVILRNGTAVGGLFFGHPERARFTAEHEQLALGVAGWAVVAMDNARLYEEAVLASRARENLLQVVSHDLRNHVSTMVVGLQILRRATPAERLRPLEAVERASGTMLRLLEDLVDIAAIEKGVLPVAPAPVEAALLLDEARALFAPAVENKGIEMRWERPPSGVQVLADRERVLQVLGNLIGNAAKFTPRGGRISVTGATSDTEITIAVADTGPGIPPEDQEHIFDRFFRGSRPSGHGAGLGLAIAHALVHAHAGKIGVDSTVGRGTTFWFTLPRTG